MKKIIKTVKEVYNNNLCCSCGFCIGVCPNQSISYKIDKKGFYKPIINKNTCKSCGICIDFCPGIQYFDYEEKKENHLYGFSENEEIRRNSSSGGIITELLCYLLKKNYVDYVLITKNRLGLSEPEVDVLDNCKEIIDAKTSKYCPVRYGKAIEMLKKIKGNVAVVGLPCHIQAIKKYYTQGMTKNVKIKYFLSLFCNHVPSFKATNFLIDNFKIKNIKKIIYRGHGWPGFIQFFTKENVILLPYRKTVHTGFGTYFKNLRCLLCDDPFGRAADASFGDAYFLNEKENGLGNTFCIVRDKELLNIFKRMEEDNRVVINNDISEEKIFQTYKVLYKRKEKSPEIMYTLSLFNRKIPANHPDLPDKLSLKRILKNIYDLFKIETGKYKFLWKILFKINKGNKIKQKANKVIINHEKGR